MSLHRRSFLCLAAISTLAACGGRSKFRSYDGPPVTSIIVSKQQRMVHLMNGNRALRSYPMQLGFAPDGHKTTEGDGRTPEGIYFIDRRNPDSSYHLSIGISYPNHIDRAQAAARGVKPGGDIFIHGTPRENHGQQDWTAGCIAVSDDHIEEIYAMVRNGTLIYLVP